MSVYMIIAYGFNIARNVHPTTTVLRSVAHVVGVYKPAIHRAGDTLEGKIGCGEKSASAD